MISNSGNSRRLEILAEGAKENGTTVILITNNPESRLAQVADYRIITATRENCLQRNSGFPCCGYGSHGNSVSSSDGRHADGSQPCAPT